MSCRFVTLVGVVIMLLTNVFVLHPPINTEMQILHRLREIETKQLAMELAVKGLIEEKKKGRGVIKPRRNILYIKIPKTWSTTFQRILYTTATKYFNFTIPATRGHQSDTVNTCDTRGEVSIGEWERFLEGNGNRKLDVFALHACLLPQMLDKRVWSLDEKPFLVTLMRNPLDQFVSRYRYNVHCCKYTKQAWCQHVCSSLNITQFITKMCPGNSCDMQTAMMTTVAKYDLVMVSERFRESLGVFGVKLKIPSWVLFYVQQNANVVVAEKKESILPQLQLKEFERTYLAKDWKAYREANDILDATIAGFSAAERSRYFQLLEEIDYGNARLAAKCNVPCNYDGIKLTGCMIKCWNEELEAMVEEFQWN